MKILWSILICSIPNRWGFTGDRPYAMELLKELDRQASEYPDVEVLLLYDNQKRTTGEKRNILLSIAKGDYISFIDDDDWVAPDYVSSIHSAIRERGVDVITFGIRASSQKIPEDPEPSWCFDNPTNESIVFDPNDPPHHTSVWHAEFARRVSFLPLNHGEDSRWRRDLRALMPTGYAIPKFLYHWSWRDWVDQARYPIPNQVISWSILICSIPNRYGFNGIDHPYAPQLLKELHQQTQEYPDVEILLLYDNQKRTTGCKRNVLLNLAKGNYISFIDDDDRVAPDYVETLRSVALYNEPDVITFEHASWCYTDRNSEAGDIRSKSAVRAPADPSEGYQPQHTCVWRTSIARSHPFPSLTMQEDVKWSEKVSPRIERYCMVPRILYHWVWRKWIDQSDYIIPVS